LRLTARATTSWPACANGTTPFGLNFLADIPDLPGQFLFCYLVPNSAAFTIIVGAIFQSRELLPPFPHQCVQSKKFGFKLASLASRLFHHTQFATGYDGQYVVVII
jgi:hypothetical protein